MIDKYKSRLTEIGERIASLREEKMWTQHKMAEKIGEILGNGEFHQGTISTWEKGKALPTVKYLLALSELFSCDIGYILCDYDAKRKDTSNVHAVTGLSNETVEMLSRLSETDRTRLELCDISVKGSYYEAVRHHLFMPTFNLMIGHRQFGVFMAMLIEFLIDRDAPMNTGGPVDPEEYNRGRRTIGAGEHSELCFTRATQTLREIMTDVSNHYDNEIKYWADFFKNLPQKDSVQNIK